MWIKHNNSLYNTNDISIIEVSRTKLKAHFHNGECVIIGEFAKVQECKEIFNSISRSLLFEDSDKPGLIIKDTKKE